MSNDIKEVGPGLYARVRVSVPEQLELPFTDFVQCEPHPALNSGAPVPEHPGLYSKAHHEAHPDPVVRPPHYTDSAVETINAIEAWGLNYRLGNCVKYISRAGKKGTSTRLEDLKKALWYLQREIDNE